MAVDGPVRGRTAQRRVVSVLFADLVGFTTLSEQLDPEEVAAVQDGYFAGVRDAVEALGGRVEKYIGDAVVAAFGVVRARDDDARRAVEAGWEVVDVVRGLTTRLGLAPDTLRVRVGVNTGEVLVTRDGGDEWRLTGDAVNVAARLQSAATPGEVVVGPVTAFAVEDAVVLRPLGALALKGKTAGVEAWAAVGRRAASAPSAPAPFGRQATVVGRDEELHRLERAVGEARDRRLTVLVAGAPGAGKTRLVTTFAQRLEGTGVPV